FRFTRKVCAACPLLSQCIAKLQKAKGRQVSTNDYEAEYQAIEAKAQTPAYQEIRRQHRRIERKLGELVRWHRLRRARYRGRMRANVQGKTCSAVSIWRAVLEIMRALALAGPSPPWTLTGAAPYKTEASLWKSYFATLLHFSEATPPAQKTSQGTSR